MKKFWHLLLIGLWERVGGTTGANDTCLITCVRMTGGWGWFVQMGGRYGGGVVLREDEGGRVLGGGKLKLQTALTTSR